MQIDFDDIIDKIIHICLDELTVCSKNRQDHFDHLKKINLCCRKFGMSLNISKKKIGVTQGKILDHIVFYSGINIDLKRVTSIPKLQAPTYKKEIQSFMGIINFVRIFILNLDVVVKPIHNMLKHDQYFSWNEDVEKYFVGIKKSISSASVLAKPDFDKEFIIYTNSTEEAIFAKLFFKRLIKTMNNL